MAFHIDVLSTMTWHFMVKILEMLSRLMDLPTRTGEEAAEPDRTSFPPPPEQPRPLARSSRA